MLLKGKENMVVLGSILKENKDVHILGDKHTPTKIYRLSHLKNFKELQDFICDGLILKVSKNLKINFEGELIINGENIDKYVEDNGGIIDVKRQTKTPRKSHVSPFYVVTNDKELISLDNYYTYFSKYSNSYALNHKSKYRLIEVGIKNPEHFNYIKTESFMKLLRNKKSDGTMCVKSLKSLEIIARDIVGADIKFKVHKQ